LDFLTTPARRRLLFASLYASEGAPIGFLWWALPTILRSRGIPVEDITVLTSILVLPWAGKFLWAPLVDVLRTRWSLKNWILSAQLLMGLTLLPLLILDLETQFNHLASFLVLHALAAATQDVSIDALCIRVTSAGERGALNGWMQTGMLTSRSLLGGGTLVLLEAFGWTPVVVLLLAVVWFSSALLVVSRVPLHTPTTVSSQQRTPFRDFLSHLRLVFSRRVTWFALLFAASSGAAFEAVGAVAGPFLIDRGFSSSQVGMFFLIPAVVSTIGGALLGGMLADRMPKVQSVRIFLFSMVACVVFLAGADGIGSGGEILLVGMTLIYFSIGLFVSSTYALFMDLTDPELGATQFSAYMGATNFCESWSAFAIGTLAGSMGYSAGFFVMAGVSLLAASILPAFPSNVSDRLPEQPPQK